MERRRRSRPDPMFNFEVTSAGWAYASLLSRLVRRSRRGFSWIEGPGLAKEHNHCWKGSRRRRSTARAKTLREPNGAYMWPSTYDEREKRVLDWGSRCLSDGWARDLPRGAVR